MLSSADFNFNLRRFTMAVPLAPMPAPPPAPPPPSNTTAAAGAGNSLIASKAGPVRNLSPRHQTY